MPCFKKQEPVTENMPRQKNRVCQEHDEEMKLYCRDCDQTLCDICRSAAHKTCKDVIKIKTKLTEVKTKLRERQHKLAEKIGSINAEIKGFDLQTKKVTGDGAKLESVIRKTIERAVQMLYEKEEQLIKKMKNQGVDDEDEDEDGEERLLEMYMSSGSEAGADVTVREKNRICAAEISFIHNLDKLKKGIEAMDVKINQLNLTASPELDEVNNAKLSELDSYYITDVLVMYIADTKVTLLVDYFNCRLMSVYTKGGESCSRLFEVSGYPWCITLSSEGKVAVSLPASRHIITIAVTPKLKLLSTIKTSKEYSGLSTLGKSTLVAGSCNPPSVDLIDMKGNILKTFTTLPGIGKRFISPKFIHVTRQGTILVSDWSLQTIVCLTRSGDTVFTYKPIGERALGNPRGITSTSTGDILVVDHTKDKVIHISESGEFIREILTAEDGLNCPTGLWIDGDKLCVALRYTGLHEYRLCYTPLIPGTGRPVQL